MMGKVEQNKKWMISFICAFLALVMFVCAVVHIVDPFFQYRVRDNQYLLNSVYVNAGLVKNADYDAVIVGSCLTQNYDKEEFDTALGVNVLKAGVGGLNNAGTLEYIMLANSVGKAKNYYINVDYADFRSDTDNNLDADEYNHLKHDDLLSQMEYMFGYETWFRFIPVDLAISVYKAIGGEMTGKLAADTSIEHDGEWSDDHVWGKEIVLENRKNRVPGQAIDENNQELLYKSLKKGMDTYLDCIDFSAGNYTFIFPPYAYLYWEDTKECNTYDVYVKAKEYMIEQIKKRGGIVYDFQFADATYDLDYYLDTVHFNKDMNSYMVQCMSTGKYKR